MLRAIRIRVRIEPTQELLGKTPVMDDTPATGIVTETRATTRAMASMLVVIPSVSTIYVGALQGNFISTANLSNDLQRTSETTVGKNK